MQITESFVLAQRAFTETLIGLGAAAFEGIKRLGELNVQAARDTVTEVGRAPQVMLTITNPQDLMTLQFSLVEARVQRVGAYGFQLQEIAIAAGSEISEVVRAGAGQIQSTIPATGELSTQSAVADAPRADGQANGQASRPANELSNGHVDKQVTLDAPLAHNASNGAKKPVSRAKPTGANEAATNKNGGRVVRNRSEKSHKRSGGSGSGSGQNRAS